MNRRELVAAGAAVGAAVIVPQTIWAALSSNAGPVATDRFMDTLCDLVVPASDTPGAVQAGVPAFVRLALTHGLRDSVPEDRAHVNQKLDELAGGRFMALDHAKQREIVERMDAAAFERGVPPSPWTRIKALILIGYYTSEIGSSKELHYELAPGRWEPDVELQPGEREWSTNWVGVKYG
jgi:hypothetical protein